MINDIGKYSNSIQFETEVYPGVYWMPINSLGKSRYTNDEIKEISKLPIEEQRDKIDSLYEAIQLFQISNFKGVFDNENHWVSDNELWQVHKDLEQSVVSNEGCCATDTNWLSYFIREKYDSIGSFCYANEDGNGHITTYIKKDEYFYFIDMMMCRSDSQQYLCCENGVLSDLLSQEWAGFLYRCKNPRDFCKFNISRFKSKSRDIPYCFYIRKTDCVKLTGVRFRDGGVTFLVPKNENPDIVYLCDSSKSDIVFADAPI